ncbi:hypothetical protein FB451DRAFT_1312015 [Mycena latifolia]|nr:hypothetical protein FB451DRAFT_1312015 [Mycena latifolia]
MTKTTVPDDVCSEILAFSSTRTLCNFARASKNSSNIVRGLLYRNISVGYYQAVKLFSTLEVNPSLGSEVNSDITYLIPDRQSTSGPEFNSHRWPHRTTFTAKSPPNFFQSWSISMPGPTTSHGLSPGIPLNTSPSLIEMRTSDSDPRSTPPFLCRPPPNSLHWRFRNASSIAPITPTNSFPTSNPCESGATLAGETVEPLLIFLSALTLLPENWPPSRSFGVSSSIHLSATST